MAINGVTTGSTVLAQSTRSLTDQLGVLQTQLVTGKKSTTYSGMGVNEGFAVAARAQLSNINAFTDTQTKINTTIGVTNAALQSLFTIGSQTKSGTAQISQTIGVAGQTVAQQSALAQLSTSLGILNTQSGDRYIFSGSAINTPSVASADAILNGNGQAAGLKQVIAERRQADLGVSGLGRLTITQPTATSVAVGEDVAGSPFGLKLASIASSLSGATVTGPAGTPATISVALGATNLNRGDAVTLKFDLPDGTTEQVSLTASSVVPNPAGSFAIGATPTATAANLKAALNSSIGTLANTSLVAASTIQASNDFFESPPQRVSGTPLNAATSLTPGISANTVQWYTGEAGTGSARASATTRIDQSVTLQYGVRANEDGIRNLLATVAAFAAVTTSATDPNGAAQVAALSSRVAVNLGSQPGRQSITDIQADFSAAQVTLNDAKSRQTQGKSLLQGMIDQAETVSPNEVATQILALQNSLQASYRTTSILSQLSLTKFL